MQPRIALIAGFARRKVSVSASLHHSDSCAGPTYALARNTCPTGWGLCVAPAPHGYHAHLRAGLSTRPHVTTLLPLCGTWHEAACRQRRPLLGRYRAECGYRAHCRGGGRESEESREQVRKYCAVRPAASCRAQRSNVPTSAGIAPAWAVVQRLGGARREPAAECGIKPCSLSSSVRPACFKVKYETLLAMHAGAAQHHNWTQAGR